MDYLEQSKRDWAMNRIEFLHYNCGIPMTDIAKHVGISVYRLRKFIKHGKGHSNLTNKELQQVNEKLDTLFRTK